MFPTKLLFIWPRSFRGEEILKIKQSETRIASSLKPLGQMNQNLVGSIYGRSSIKMLISSRFVNKHGHILYTAFQGCFLPSFDSFGQAVSEKKIFLEINQSETRMGPAHLLPIR
jgi:hypothetical protein